MDSEIHYDRDRPPSYQQALSLSHEGLHKYSAPYNSQIPSGSNEAVVARKFGNRPVTMNCPYCGHLVTTIVEEENGPMVFILALSLALCGMFLGCCLITFCISDLKDKIHICPRCQATVGEKLLL